jgi:hypothetical protein
MNTIPSSQIIKPSPLLKEAFMILSRAAYDSQVCSPTVYVSRSTLRMYSPDYCHHPTKYVSEAQSIPVYP